MRARVQVASGLSIFYLQHSLAQSELINLSLQMGCQPDIFHLKFPTDLVIDPAFSLTFLEKFGIIFYNLTEEKCTRIIPIYSNSRAF